MPVITQGVQSSLSFEIQTDGMPVELNGDEKYRIYRGRDPVTEEMPVKDGTTADKLKGIVNISVPAEETEKLQLGTHVIIINGDFGVRRFSVSVEDIMGGDGSFSCLDRDQAITKMRRDMLVRSAIIHSKKPMSDDYLWDKLRAAEKDLEHRLKTTFTPCHYIPMKPTPDQLEKLSGTRWDIDPGYDYSRKNQRTDAWGMLTVRKKPLIDVIKMRTTFPAQGSTLYDYPPDWLRIYPKYGQIQIVPTGTGAVLSSSSVAIVQQLAMTSIPLMMQIEYTAGLKDVHTEYPDLIDVIYKTAVVKITEDLMAPSSGSISADGLSQSISIDTAKYRDMIDAAINGTGSGNGGLMVQIHGVRIEVAS